MNEFDEVNEYENEEPKQTLDISSGYHAYQDMGDSAFEVYVNGFYGMAITVPGALGSEGTDLVIVIPSGDIKAFLSGEEEEALDRLL